MPTNSDAKELLANREAYEKNAERNIFVIMRYGHELFYAHVERAIKETVALYGFQAHLARDIAFWPADLWRNIEFFMDHARYGVVVFERMKEPEFNPNIAIELGYMLGAGKSCLALREKAFPKLPTDVVGHLYEDFDATHVRKTVQKAIEAWMKKLKHEKIRITEIISAAKDLDAKKNRTERLLEVLASMKTARPKGILRQAGSLSSLAISKREGLLESEDPLLKRLLLKERKSFEALVREGIIVRCLISPFVQIVSLQLKILKPEYVRSDVLPRLEQLRDVLSRNLGKSNLQIACTSRLPHDNILIDDAGCLVFVGKRRLRQWGFPHTTIHHDPALVRAEAERFDSAFIDAAAACLQRQAIKEDEFGCRELKLSVIQYIDDCRDQLETMTSGVNQPKLRAVNKLSKRGNRRSRPSSGR